MLVEFTFDILAQYHNQSMLKEGKKRSKATVYSCNVPFKGCNLIFIGACSDFIILGSKAGVGKIQYCEC